MPDAPHLKLWHVAAILREHRGDGRLAALLVAGLDPVEALVPFAATGAASAERFESRGWSAAEWAAARDRLVARGPVEPDGTATEAGRELRRPVELHTDDMAVAPWRSLGAEASNRLAELLGDYWVAVLGSGLLPSETTLAQARCEGVTGRRKGPGAGWSPHGGRRPDPGGPGKASRATPVPDRAEPPAGPRPGADGSHGCGGATAR